MYAPGLDVVTVNYRTPTDLAGFLHSLDTHAPTVPFDAVVVNVDPLEEDKRVAENWARGSAEGGTIAFDWNAGYARACNRGAQLGNREVIGLFNADVRLTAGALDDCYRALLSDPTWGILGPRQVDEVDQLTAGGIFGTNEKPQHRGWMEAGRARYQDVRDDAIVVVGSAFFIRRSLWDKLRHCPIYQRVAPEAEGAFLPTPMFYEEAACCYHAAAHGMKNVFYGPVTIVHRWHRSVKENNMENKARAWFKGESRAMFAAFCDAHGIGHDCVGLGG